MAIHFPHCQGPDETSTKICQVVASMRRTGQLFHVRLKAGANPNDDLLLTLHDGTVLTDSVKVMRSYNRKMFMHPDADDPSPLRKSEVIRFMFDGEVWTGKGVIGGSAHAFRTKMKNIDEPIQRRPKWSPPE